MEVIIGIPSRADAAAFISLHDIISSYNNQNNDNNDNNNNNNTTRILLPLRKKKKMEPRQQQQQQQPQTTRFIIFVVFVHWQQPAIVWRGLFPLLFQSKKNHEGIAKKTITSLFRVLRFSSSSPSPLPPLSLGISSSSNNNNNGPKKKKTHTTPTSSNEEKEEKPSSSSSSSSSTTTTTLQGHDNHKNKYYYSRIIRNYHTPINVKNNNDCPVDVHIDPYPITPPTIINTPTITTNTNTNTTTAAATTTAQQQQSLLLLWIQPPTITTYLQQYFASVLIKFEHQMILYQSLAAWFSTLGGGHFFCRHLQTAIMLAKKQRQIAIYMGDYNMVYKCTINEAYSYIYAGKFQQAIRTIDSIYYLHQRYEHGIHPLDDIIINMCASAKLFCKRFRKASKKLKSTRTQQQASNCDDYQRIRMIT